MESKIEHLKMIQGIITRMNTNSFQIKGWTITLVSALLALYANSRKVTYIFIALIPVLIFWFLDSYYLGSFANVGVVKSICKQVQTAAYQGSNHGISATGGFTSHGYSCRNRVSFVN